MNLDLGDKVALVTGASRGLGFAIARALGREGCRLAINGRNPADLQNAQRDLGAETLVVPGDVTHADTAAGLVSAVERHFGRLDILVANVGSGASVAPGSETDEEWTRVFSVNMWSLTNMVQAARSALARTRGSVVAVSSICGEQVVPGAPVTYSAAKASLNAYVAGMARPLGAEGVRISAVAPGNLLFPGSVWERKQRENAAQVDEMLRREVPLKRLGSAEEVADIVAFMASPRCGFVTGCVWTADGGQSR